MVGRSSEQLPVALGIGSPRETVGYPSQYSADFTRRVQGSGEVGVQVAPEEGDFPDIALFLIRPVLELANDRIIENSSFPRRHALPGFLPSLRPRLGTWAAPGPALRPRDVSGYFSVGSFVGGIPAEEVPLRVQSARRRRWGATPLSR
jgi:hypothetical protein